MFENNDNNNNYEYHYSYQPQQPETRPSPWEEPKKHNKRWPKVVAAVLCAALLLGGTFGAGWFLSGGRDGSSDKEDTTQVMVSDREPVEVQTVSVTGSQKLTFPEIYAANVDSCVSIYVVSSAGYNIFGQQVVNASSGSGFVITKDGYIVTNYHVIEDGSTVQVSFNDGTTYDAQIVGGDADYDVAVLKIDPGDKELKPVVIDTSGSLLVGDDIMTIGNPLGELTFSLSDGRVSCLNREINVDGTPFNMIQISAPVNHGNSGGPLFNIYGEVVGIVSAKYGNSSSDSSVEGLGFAIPIEDVMDLIKDIMENGQVTSHAWLGVENRQANNGQNPQSNVAGAYITGVTAGGPAEKAGLKAGDVITMLGTTQITSWTDLQTAVGSKSFKAGDTTTITYVRDGKVYTAEVTFGSTTDMPEDDKTSEQQDQQNVQPQPNNGGTYYDDSMENFFNQFFGSR